MEQTFKKRNRIGDGTFIMMIGVALLFEGLQAVIGFMFVALGLIPALGIAFWFAGYLFAFLITTFEYLLFWLWLPKPEGGGEWMDRAKWFFGSGALETIPFVSMLPLSAAGVIQTALLVRKRDREYNKEHAKEANPLPVDRPRSSRIRNAAQQLRNNTVGRSTAPANRLAGRPIVNSTAA